MENRLDGPALAHPIFDAVRPRLAAELGAAPCTERGIPVRFVAPAPGERGSYELRVFETGCVETRPGNWHDLFNALAWLAYPRAKARLNALHAAEIPRENGRRGPVRDMLTIFDEGGAVAACADPELAAMIRGFRWRELFWQQRARVLSGLRFVVFGHAVLEKALAPWAGITCKALIVPVERALIDGPPAGLVAALDTCAADWLATHAVAGSPKALAPLPVFGYPGWLPGSAQAAFYEDTRYFRPLRQETRPA